MRFLTYKYLFVISFLTFVGFGFWILNYLDDEFINAPLKIKLKKDDILITSKINELNIENIILNGENCLIEQVFPIKLGYKDRLKITTNCDAKSIEIETEQNIIFYNFS